MVKQGHFKEAVRLGYAYIDTVMEGIEYYQRYQQSILLLLIKASFVGCALTNLAKLLSTGRNTNSVLRRHSASLYCLLGLVVAAANLAWLCQKLPPHFLLYYTAPVFVWAKLGHYLLTRTFDTAVTRLGGLMLLQAAAVLLILRESFFDRRWLSLGFLTLLIHPIVNSQIIPRQGYGDQQQLTACN